MASKGSPDTYILSGYIIMAILSGYVFVNNIIRWKMLGRNRSDVDDILSFQTLLICFCRFLYCTIYNRLDDI